MDTGEGGANDNLFYGNDFSFAPTNGMEATFSRNTFVANRIEGSDHGLWGGYSFDSKVVGNDFRRNRIGIAIEHGQNNDIANNRFVGDSTGISLWANPIEPSDWGYPKHRDTRSRDYVIRTNLFVDERVARSRGGDARHAPNGKLEPANRLAVRAHRHRRLGHRARRDHSLGVSDAGLSASRRRRSHGGPTRAREVGAAEAARRPRSRALDHSPDAHARPSS